jgi:hypothetical protein
MQVHNQPLPTPHRSLLSAHSAPYNLLYIP